MAQKRSVDPYRRFMAYMALLYAQGLTNASIAAKLGVHERTVYKWMSRERSIGPLVLGAMQNIVTRPSA